MSKFNFAKIAEKQLLSNFAGKLRNFPIYELLQPG